MGENENVFLGSSTLFLPCSTLPLGLFSPFFFSSPWSCCHSACVTGILAFAESHSTVHSHVLTMHLEVVIFIKCVLISPLWFFFTFIHYIHIYPSECSYCCRSLSEVEKTATVECFIYASLLCSTIDSGKVYDEFGTATLWNCWWGFIWWSES